MPRTHLIGRAPQSVTELLRQPHQLKAFATITSLIEAVRKASSDHDYYGLQLDLFEEVFKAQQALQWASRNLEREKKGKQVAPPLTGSWEQDRALWERIQRQFRAIGDALVWRRLAFDRRYILAYSRNADPGPITARLEGLRAEVKEVFRLWNSRGQLALLHDLTNCLRIGDLTVFGGTAPEVRDVKSNPARRLRPAQVRRMNQALEFLHSRGPLHSKEGEFAEFISSHQIKTRFADLERGLAIAEQQGFASVYLSRGWALDCFAAVKEPLDAPARPLQETTDRIQARKAQTYRRAGLDRAGIHRVSATSAGEIGASPALAPPTIFPLGAAMCARLTCDLAAYQTVMSWDLLADAFRGEGFAVTCPLRPAFNEALGAEDPYLVATDGTRRLTITAGGISQVTLELVEPNRYAAAMREATKTMRTPGLNVLSFANEPAVWR